MCFIIVNIVETHKLVFHVKILLKRKLKCHRLGRATIKS